MNTSNQTHPLTTADQRPNQTQQDADHHLNPLTTADQRPNQAQEFAEEGQQRSLERGESVMTEDQMEGDQIMDVDGEEMDPLDNQLLSHAEGLEDMDDDQMDEDLARKNGQATEDDANPSEYVYGQGRMSHGVDLDAPADSGTFGDPNDDLPKERLAGNER